MSSWNRFDSQWWEWFWQLRRKRNHFDLQYRQTYSDMDAISGKFRWAQDTIFILTAGPYWQKSGSYSEGKEVEEKGLGSGVGRKPAGGNISSQLNSIHALICPAASVALRTQSGSSKWLPSSHHGNLKRQLQPGKAALQGDQDLTGANRHSPQLRLWETVKWQW